MTKRNKAVSRNGRNLLCQDCRRFSRLQDVIPLIVHVRNAPHLSGFAWFCDQCKECNFVFFCDSWWAKRDISIRMLKQLYDAEETCLSYPSQDIISIYRRTFQDEPLIPADEHLDRLVDNFSKKLSGIVDGYHFASLT